MKQHEDWCEYEPGDIRRIEEYYDSRHRLTKAWVFVDECVDFERACKKVGCWRKFLNLKRDDSLDFWEIYAMVAFLNQGGLK